MTLLHDLNAFYLEHRHCGDLTGDVEGNRVRLTCSRGAGVSRALEPAARGDERYGGG